MATGPKPDDSPPLLSSLLSCETTESIYSNMGSRVGGVRRGKGRQTGQITEEGTGKVTGIIF